MAAQQLSVGLQTKWLLVTYTAIILRQKNGFYIILETNKYISIILRRINGFYIVLETNK